MLFLSSPLMLVNIYAKNIQIYFVNKIIIGKHRKTQNFGFFIAELHILVLNMPNLSEMCLFIEKYADLIIDRGLVQQ